MKPALVAFTLSILAVIATAQDYGYDHGRIRFAEPGVTLQRATESGAEEAALNSPFFPGDRVWTEATGRAEFQFPDGSVVRLDRRSKLDYVAHEEGSADETIALRLWSGSLFLHVRDRGPSARFELEAPGGLVSISMRGIYRLDAEPHETRLYVLEGEAVLDAGERRLVVEEGETVAVRRGEWPDDPRRFDLDRLDDFAYWDRERAELEAYGRESRSARYLPQEVAPYASELDAYGTWHYETEVGYVWAPTVQVGWRPYWNGRWCWTTYGWTWIPAEPWGFAPAHYGRWGFSAGLGWYWIPGRTWGPAWVSWAVGRDHVGWCPLGHRDRPVWGLDRAVSRGYGSIPTRGAGWTFTRRGDMGARDFARYRLDARSVELTSLQVTESPRARPSRDLRVIETPRATPRASHEGRGLRDQGPTLRSDRAHTMPWPGAVRRDRETERRGGEVQAVPEAERRRGGTGTPSLRSGETPRARQAPAARPRSGEGVDLRFPADGRPRGERLTPTERTTPAAPREPAGSPSRESARPRDREPDRDVMRQLFQPLAEPRAVAPRGESGSSRGGDRPRPSSGATPRGGADSRDRDGSSRGGGESRAQPAPRPNSRSESRPSSSAPPRGGDAERRKPPRR